MPAIKKKTVSANKKKTVSANKKKTVAKTNKTPRLVWTDLTKEQQNFLRKRHAAALAKARQEIAAGGKTLLRTTAEGWKIYASNEKLVLQITPACVKQACRSSKEDCVIARAIQKHQAFASGWQIGKNISLIYSEGERAVVRYGTSAKLARALNVFDRTGKWPLMSGHYSLKPLPAGYRVGTRWAWYKGSGGKASKFKGTKRSATRSGTYRGAIRKAS